MRILGPVTHDADKTTTSNMLSQAMLTRPEIMMNALNMWEDNISMFGSFLQRRGLTSRGLYTGLERKNFKVVGNKTVMWPVASYPMRKGKVISHTGGGTPGLNGAEFSIVINIDWFSVNDRLELGDQRTHVHVLSKVRTGDSSFTYRVKLVSNSDTAFADPLLLSAGKEIGFVHTAFPELSEDAGEKHVYPNWQKEFLTIQRMKYTISGTAKAEKLWIEHNGVKMWDYSQNIDMLKRWAMAMENQMLYGKATKDANDRVYLADDWGREIISGNGLIAQGDNSLKMGYNYLNVKFLQKMMQTLQLLQTSQGTLEIAVLGGTVFINQLHSLFQDVLHQNPIPLIVTGADGLAVKTRFTYYQFGDVILHFMRHPSIDAPYRATEKDAMGNNLNSGRAYFISLGNTVAGNPGVQLLALGNGGEDRSFVQRVINGMTGAGPTVTGGSESGRILASSPVDGMQVHILSETGIALMDTLGFAEIFPYRRR